MKVTVLFLVLTILFLTQISASCEEGQIDINSASVEELDQLYGIGPVKAQAIIDSGPFNSVDDLINVKGIGEITLNNIKSQNLACVDDKEETNKEDDNATTEVKVNINMNINNSSLNTVYNSSSPKETELKTIELNSNPKAIKSEADSEVSGKRNYAIYGLFAFGIMLGLLFLIKKLVRGKRQKNEFA